MCFRFVTESIGIVLVTTATKSPGSLASLIGIQLLNISNPEANWLYQSDNDTNIDLSLGDWLPFSYVDSTMIDYSLPSITKFAIHIPQYLAPPSFLLGVHVTVVESSNLPNPRTFTWMLRLQVVIYCTRHFIHNNTKTTMSP
jgi:hypothetical protein